MKDIQQLIKKSNEVGRYDNVFPKTFIDAIKDRETGVSLREILSSFNMFFLPYVGSKTATRLLLPKSFRRQGVWLTYVTWNKTVVIEWYDNDAIDDASFGDDVNWRQGSNMLVGDLSISAEGNWVINGEDTDIPARGEKGITPILRVSEDNRLEVSYNEGNTWNSFRDIPVFVRYRVHNNKLQESVNFEKTWEDVSDYIGAWFRWNKTSEIDGTLQISRDEKKTWEDISPIIVTDIITNSEDIVKNDAKELEFANKEYNPEEFSGLGRLYLRKNIVNGINTLTQDMLNKTNTRYIIQYDYNLNGETITVPRNAILEFQGGHLYNGTLNGDFKIDSIKTKIFENIIIKNYIDIKKEWFGFKSKTANDYDLNLIPNNKECARHNFAVLKYAIENLNININFNDIYYIDAEENSIELDYDLKLFGGTLLISNCSSLFLPKKGMALNVEKVKIQSYNNRAANAIISNNTLDFILGDIIFESCVFNNIRLFRLEFKEQPIGVDSFGNSKIIVNNCHIDTDFTFAIIISGLFHSPVNYTNNTIVNLVLPSLYIGNRKEEDNTLNRIKKSHPIYIINNSFIGKVTADAYYLCSALIDTNTVYFKNNLIDNIINTGTGTCYDAYLSCINVFYENNTINNMMSFPLNGKEKAQCEIFKSKGYVSSELLNNNNAGVRYFSNNSYTVDSNYLQSLGADPKDIYYNIFNYSQPMRNVVFKNNSLKYIGEGYINFMGSTTAMGNVMFDGNYIKATAINSIGSLIRARGGNTNIDVVNNTFDFETPSYISLFLQREPTNDDDFEDKDKQLNRLNLSNNTFVNSTILEKTANSRYLHIKNNSFICDNYASNKHIDVGLFTDVFSDYNMYCDVSMFFPINNDIIKGDVDSCFIRNHRINFNEGKLEYNLFPTISCTNFYVYLQSYYNNNTNCKYVIDINIVNDKQSSTLFTYYVTSTQDKLIIEDINVDDGEESKITEIETSINDTSNNYYLIRDELYDFYIAIKKELQNNTITLYSGKSPDINSNYSEKVSKITPSTIKITKL